MHKMKFMTAGFTGRMHVSGEAKYSGKGRLRVEPKLRAVTAVSILGKHDGVMSDELLDMLREADE